MTVTSNETQTTALGDAIETDFTFSFPLSNSDDLFVTMDIGAGPVDQAGNFSVTYVIGDQSGTCVFDVAPPDLAIIVMTRITPRTQDILYPIGGAFPSRSHEGALDKLTMIMIEAEDEIGGFEIINTRPAQRDVTGAGPFLQTDEGRVLRCGGAGGYAITFLGDLVLNTAITIKNVSASPITVEPFTAKTINWLSGIGIQGGIRTLAVGAIMTLQVDNADPAVCEVWGNGTS